MNAPSRQAVPLEQDDRAFANAQQFLLLAKRFWTTQLHQALRTEYDAGALRVPANEAMPESSTTEGIDATPHARARVQIFSWLERHLQRQKYAGRYGLQHWLARDRDTHQAWLSQQLEVAQAAGRLSLDPSCLVPVEFAAVDIHQHPGGVWRDPLAGMVYERGARTTTPMAGKRHLDLHERLAQQVAADCEAPNRLIDLGCGFGKSTRALYQHFPACQIVAVDVAAPCLMLGAALANEDQADNILYRQADARHCGEASQSADVVTSTMLLHEMPAAHLPALFAECWRLLKPGGVMRHLDFLPAVQPRYDSFLNWLHLGHARRNNEVFMAELLTVDLPDLLLNAGFIDISIEAFEEADGALSPDYPNWRFPWATVSARKPV